MTLAAHAQSTAVPVTPGSPCCTNAPKTAYEAMNTTTEALLLRGMTVIGTLNNQVGYPVEIRAERLTNLQTTNSVYAVVLRTRVGQQLMVDYIDYDELDGLIRAVTEISQAQNNSTAMENFDLAYRTRSGFSLSKLGKGARVTIAMTSGDYNGVRNQMASFVLDDFGRYLTAAKAKLDNIIANGL